MNKEKLRADFIILWNQSGSVQEVMRRSGYTYQSATSKASYLRKNGFGLKKFYQPKEFMRRIGAVGGKNGTTGGFYYMKYIKGDDNFAREQGRKGGLRRNNV